MPQVSGQGERANTRPVRSGLSRGLLGHEGNSCRPHRHLAPVRRAHRAPDRAFRGGGGLPRRTVRSAQGVQASHERFRCQARDPRERGWQPRAARLPRAHPACTSRSQSGMGGLDFGERATRRAVRSVQGGAVSALAPAPRAQREILASAGGSRAPRGPPAPSPRAHRARARARVRREGFGCAARPATVRRNPRAGGARARRDAGRGPTWPRDPPSHDPHARRARGRRARASRWGLGGGIQRTARLDPVLWAPRPPSVLG